ncbi:MAG: hypothetical protein LW860_20870 [Xanthomonadaceae bacterium]|nr:hypothetical protein [Xanthomonadaceae bacterium]
MDYGVWVVLHILAAGYWLGTDLAVYYTAGTIADRKAPPAVRLWAGKAMLLLDMVPRTCLILTLAFGVTLAAQAGFLAPLAPWLPAVWVAALAWLALTWSVFRLEHSPLGHRLARIDFGLRIAIAAGCLYGAALLWTGSDAIARTPWLSLKLAILGAIIALGLVIRVQLKPFGPLFGKAVSGQATAADEDALARLIARVKVPVWLIWIAVGSAIALGRMKPYF